MYKVCWFLSPDIDLHRMGEREGEWAAKCGQHVRPRAQGCCRAARTAGSKGQSAFFAVSFLYGSGSGSGSCDLRQWPAKCGQHVRPRAQGCCRAARTAGSKGQYAFFFSAIFARIRILLFSSVTFKMATENDFFCLLLPEASFTSFFKDKKSWRSCKTLGFKFFLTIFAW